MGHEIDQTADTAVDNTQNAALMQVIIDTHSRPGDPQKTESLGQANISHSGDSDMGINRFENGVGYGTGKGSQMVEAPMGGKVLDKNGQPVGTSLEGMSKDGMAGVKVTDASGKVVAEFDKNNTLHVHTKNGEYTETRDGQVTFAPKGEADLTKLHKEGSIANGKMEDYGMTKNGNDVKLPNGVIYDTKTHNLVLPADLGNTSTSTVEDMYTGKELGKVVKGPDGQKLYTIDETNGNILVPTQDGGTITINQKGQMRFDAKEVKIQAPKHQLPHLTIE